MKRLIVLFIVALVLATYVVPVLAEGSGGGGSSSGGSGGDSGSSGSEKSGSDGSSKEATSHDSGSADSSSKDSSSGSKDSSTSGSEAESKSSSDSSSKDAAEVEIEHGITIIKTHESEHFSTLSIEHASQPEDSSQKSRDSVVIVTSSLTSLSSVPGPTTTKLAEHAKTIEDSLSHFSADEKSIQTRNGIVTFFFGGDKPAANDIETHIKEDIAALDAMDKLLNDPTTSPSLKAFTQLRIATIRAELERLKGIAESEKQKKGFFG
jgi:hypothetical protein